MKDTLPPHVINIVLNLISLPLWFWRHACFVFASQAYLYATCVRMCPRWCDQLNAKDVDIIKALFDVTPLPTFWWNHFDNITLKLNLEVQTHWKTSETTLQSFTKDNHADICLLLLFKNVNPLWSHWKFSALPMFFVPPLLCVTPLFFSVIFSVIFS